MSDVANTRLKDCIDINPTVKLSKGQVYPCIEMEKISVGVKKANDEDTAVYMGQSCSKFQSNDTLMARITPCLENGKIAKYVHESEGFGSTELLVLRAKEGLSTDDYVYYLARSRYVQNMAVNSMTGASGRQRADAKFIGKIKWEFPPLYTQNKITAVLSAYDELIEKNNKRIEILEQMAENLYKEWFVRFRFPGHEETEFEQGVPKEWRNGVLCDIATFLSGFAFKSDTFTDCGKYKVVTIKNVQDGKFDGENVDCVDDLPKGMPGHCVLLEGDLLVSLTGNIGRVCRVVGEDYLLNQRVAKVKTNFPNYVYLLLKSEDLFQAMNNLANGTAQLNLSPVKMKKIPLLVPIHTLIMTFEAWTKPLFEEIRVLNHQNRNLTKQRDRLLPRLMSGKLDV